MSARGEAAARRARPRAIAVADIANLQSAQSVRRPQ